MGSVATEYYCISFQQMNFKSLDDDFCQKHHLKNSLQPTAYKSQNLGCKCMQKEKKEGINILYLQIDYFIYDSQGKV